MYEYFEHEINETGNSQQQPGVEEQNYPGKNQKDDFRKQRISAHRKYSRRYEFFFLIGRFYDPYCHNIGRDPDTEQKNGCGNQDF